MTWRQIIQDFYNEKEFNTAKNYCIDLLIMKEKDIDLHFDNLFSSKEGKYSLNEILIQLEEENKEITEEKKKFEDFIIELPFSKGTCTLTTLNLK